MNRFSIYSLFLCMTFNLLCMENQLSPLHEAVLAHDLNRVKSLIKEQGVDPKEKDSNGETAFDYAVKSTHGKKIAAYLYPYYYDLEGLEKIIGYTFKNVEKIIKAFTTRKFCPKRNYEIFEWFGDAILHEVLTVMLDDQHYENADEGKLTQARQALERKEPLAELSKKLGFDRYIIKNDQDLITIDMLEDVVEALIAAIYKDGGALPAQKFILKYWLPMLKNSTKAPTSPIHILEILKGKGCLEFVRTSQNLAEFRLRCQDFEITGRCSSNECGAQQDMKRIARYRAARELIEALPNEFDEFKERILISPLSLQYQIDSHEPEYILDTKRWESHLPSEFSYKIRMISHMLYQNDKDKSLKFDTSPPIGKDHDPIFISTLSCSWLNEKLTGKPAKTKKGAEENVAKLAYQEWIKQTQGEESDAIDPRKLVFIQLIKKQMSMPNGRNSQQLLLELTQQLGKDKPDYNDYLVGGKLSDPLTGQFYSTVSCFDITKQVITGEHCPSILKARKSAASIMLNIIIKKLMKSKKL